MGGPILIQACLNGARPPAVHPALPITPAQIGDDIRAVVRAGADAVHVHAKDDDGLDTLDPDAVDAVVMAVKAAAPGLPISVTTGAWALPDPMARVEAVRGWTVLPEVASVNWHEEGAADVVHVLMERGIGVEAGLWSLEDVAAFVESPVRDCVRRVLIELPDGIDEARIVELSDAMIDGVCAAAPELPILLHGEGESAWPALRHALQLGLEARIGLEDVLHLPDGEPAPDNAAMVSFARAMVQASPW